MHIPLIVEATLSDTILRKSVSDFDGITAAVLTRPPELIETTSVPILSLPSEIEIKFPLSYGTICTKKSL